MQAPDAKTYRDRVGLAALAVADFASPCYGPEGLAKCIQQADGSARVLRSGASALREAGVADPDVQPYVELAQAVQEHAGDQATGAVLLAARLVARAVRGMDDGAPAAAYTEGYALALRQSRAALSSLARPDPGGDSLAAVTPGWPGLAAATVQGLQELAAGRDALDLDAVDVRTEGAAAAWLPGVVARPQFAPPSGPPGPVAVLLLSGGWKAGPWSEGVSYRMTAAHRLSDWAGEEDRMRRAALSHLKALGVGFVACHRDIEEDLAQRLAQAGMLVWNDAPESALRRLQRATGATPAARLAHAAAADLGRATLTKRRHPEEGWLVAGAGPSATLVLPAATASAKAAAEDQGERLLRAAGCWLREKEAVPGGGRWQRELASSLRRAMDAAPGKSPLALRAAAEALDGLADDLVRNAGLDPLARRLPPGDVLDPALCVRVAVVAAFEAAIQVIRIDARYAKQPSSTAGLRGGEGKPLSLREMAGDVPPDM